jgi:hypothetical protein
VAAMPLSIFLARRNAIRDVAPLAGKPFDILDLSHNAITSLAPMAGATPRMFTCEGNPLQSLEPFVEQPPRVFTYYDPRVPRAAVAHAVARWSTDPSLAAHARDARAVLALLDNDTAALRREAVAYGGHHYLHLPYNVSIQEADSLCRHLGGHLLTIGDESERRVVGELVDSRVWVWTGLRTEQGHSRWVTGEQLGSYVAVLGTGREGNYAFAGQHGLVPFPPDGEAHTIVEWD